MKRFSLTLPFLILLISCDKPQREVVVEKWDDGTPSKVNFVVGEGLKQEIVGRMTFYENGVIQTKEEYRENKNNGLYIRYYENGQKKWEGTYKNGKKDGKWTSWYKNGQKWEEDTYRDEKLNGLSTEWYENGQKEVEGTFKEGKEISRNCWEFTGKECECSEHMWEGCK